MKQGIRSLSSSNKSMLLGYMSLPYPVSAVFYLLSVQDAYSSSNANFSLKILWWSWSVTRYNTGFDLLLLLPFIVVSLYTLFVGMSLSPRSKTVTVSSLTPVLFEQLYLKHGETLSCPCSTITIPYNMFVNSTPSYHPVCSSVFTSRRWIEALYHPQAAMFVMDDFRKTAKSQVSRFSSWRKQLSCEVVSCIFLDNLVDDYKLEQRESRWKQNMIDLNIFMQQIQQIILL